MENVETKGKIEFMQKPHDDSLTTSILHPILKQWFFEKFKTFSEPQRYSIYNIHCRMNTLVSAPTGSGKTLSAFGAVLNELLGHSEKGTLQDRVYCVYVSPLRALSNDIHKNLIEPLEQMEEQSGKKFGIRVGVRTGDTSATEKSKMLKTPPHILITTPESLAIMLASIKFVDHLRNVEWVIVDEVHAIADNKRGVHLSLALETLSSIAPHITRIGLSATVAPLEKVAGFLVGTHRDCHIVDVQFLKKLDLQVICPVPDLIGTPHEIMHAEMYRIIDDLVQQHKTTLIFTNTRSATERVVDHLKHKFPKNYTDNIGAHHGSLSKEHRQNLERRLREGKLKCVVCLEGNSKILTENGDWIKIKDLSETCVQSLNTQLKLNNHKIITKITKSNNEPLIKLKSDFGKEIICTKEHKFLTINPDGNLVWKEAQNLKVSDFVATIRAYSYKPFEEKELKKYTLEHYPDDKFVLLKNSFRQSLKNKILQQFKTLKKFWNNYVQNVCSYSQFKSSINGKYALKIEILKLIIETLGLEHSITFNNVTHISSNKIKTPKIELNEDFLRLVGFMLADGYLSDRTFFISNRNIKLLEYYGTIIKKLSGKSTFTSKISTSGTPIYGWESIFLSQFLQAVGCKKGRKARIMNIPPFIFRLPRHLLASFLSGYIDGDGFIEIKSEDNRPYSIGFTTTSKLMADDLVRILLREGICSSLRSKYVDEVQYLNSRPIIKKGWFYDVVILGGEHLRAFASLVSPLRENLMRIKEVESLGGHCNLDIVPQLGNKIKSLRQSRGISTYHLQKEGHTNTIKYELGSRNISRNKLSNVTQLFQEYNSSLTDLSTSDLFWEKLTSKEIIPKTEFVYNIEVEQDHNYVANGFITKNCSTSLELGIDIGYIDLVICLSSPKSVARFLQRAGRAGHKLHETVKARIIVMDRDDLVECGVLLKAAVEKKIDKVHIPVNCLDVLAQYLDGLALMQVWDENELYELVKRSYCYKDLKHTDYLEILSYLAGEFTTLEDRYIFAKIWRQEGKLGKRGKLGRIIYMTNLGTIPDESFVIVKVGTQTIGHIDEGFLEKLRPGDVFVLGGDTYQFKFSRGMVAQVVATSNRPPTVPSWFSDMLPLSFDLANEIGTFRFLMEDKLKHEKSKKEVLDFIHEYLYVDNNSAEAVYNYFVEQYSYVEQLPSHRKILIEHYSDDKQNKIIFHTLYGRRVNDVLSRAVAFVIAKMEHRDVEIGMNDNGFYVGFTKKVDAVKALRTLKAEKLDLVMKYAIDQTEILKRRFRHCATRGFMILRNYMGRQKNAGRQQVSSMILMSAVKRISEDFCMLKEARREVLEDLMDIENAKKILLDIELGKIKIIEIHTRIPSPFAFNIALQGFMDVLKIEDKIEFLRRMHELVLAKISLEKGRK